jgi:hypothetical protein
MVKRNKKPFDSTLLSLHPCRHRQTPYLPLRNKKYLSRGVRYRCVHILAVLAGRSNTSSSKGALKQKTCLHKIILLQKEVKPGYFSI